MFIHLYCSYIRYMYNFYSSFLYLLLQFLKTGLEFTVCKQNKTKKVEYTVNMQRAVKRNGLGKRNNSQQTEYTVSM